MTKGLTGVSIVCSLSNGTLVETQIMNYALLDADKVTTAFVEAGGLYPEYVNNQNIDQIEKNMNAAAQRYHLRVFRCRIYNYIESQQ